MSLQRVLLAGWAPRLERFHDSASAKHRWYYFSEMGADEVLLLECFDSAEDGRARFTAHTAFDDPRAPKNARPRESTEGRTIAFFPRSL